MTQQTTVRTEAQEFMALVNQRSVLYGYGFLNHVEYLETCKRKNVVYGPKREANRKPNVLPFPFLPPGVQESNIGPAVSIFGHVQEKVDRLELKTVAEVLAYVRGLVDETGKVPDLELGERTWRGWSYFVRPLEPTHPNLVSSYMELDAGTRDYDLTLNGKAATYLGDLAEAWVAKKKADDEYK